MMATSEIVRPFARLVVKADAERPWSKLESLLKEDSIFKGVFERRSWRRADRTTETFEAFLTERAVSAGLEDQDVADLLIDWRRKHSLPFIEDPRHYRKLIDKARAATERDSLLRNVDRRAPLSRADALQQLSAMLEVELISVKRFKTDPATYELQLGNGARVEFPNNEALLRQSGMAGALFDYANIVMPTFKTKDWPKVTQLIGWSMETIESPPEFTYLGMCKKWLRDYLLETLRADVDQHQALIDGWPGIVNAATWFSMDGLRKFIMRTELHPPTKQLLSVRLKQIGCSYDERLALRSGDYHTSRSLWAAPRDLLSDEDLETRKKL